MRRPLATAILVFTLSFLFTQQSSSTDYVNKFERDFGFTAFDGRGFADIYQPELLAKDIKSLAASSADFSAEQRQVFEETVDQLLGENRLRFFFAGLKEYFKAIENDKVYPPIYKNFQAQFCSPVLKAFNKVSLKRSPHSFDLSELFLFEADGKRNVNNISKVKVRNMLQNAFEARIALRERIRGFYREKAFGDNKLAATECYDDARRALRSLRSWEDYWGTFFLQRLDLQEQEEIKAIVNSNAEIDQWASQNVEDIPMKKEVPTREFDFSKKIGVFEGGNPHYFVNPKYADQSSFKLSDKDKFDFVNDMQSGFLLMTRGAAFTGAVIGHAQAVDNQFSHAAIVYRDEKGLFKDKDIDKETGKSLWYKGKAYVVEAVPAKGVHFESVESYLHHDLTRVAVYDYRPLPEVDVRPNSPFGVTVPNPNFGLNGDERENIVMAPSHVIRKKMGDVAARLASEGLIYNFSMKMGPAYEISENDDILPTFSSQKYVLDEDTQEIISTGPSAYQQAVSLIQNEEGAGERLKNGEPNDRGLFCSQFVKFVQDVACLELQEEINFQNLKAKHGKDQPSRYDIACDTLLPGQTFPAVISKFKTKENNLLSSILGFDIEQTVAPADVEIAPRSVLVAEWRAYNKLPKNIIEDIVTTQLFFWMEDHGYRFQESGVGESLKPIFRQATAQARSITNELDQLPPHVPQGFVDGTLLVAYLMEFPSLAKLKGPLQAISSSLSEDSIKDFSETLTMIREITGLPKIEGLTGDAILEHLLDHMGLTTAALGFQALDFEAQKKAIEKAQADGKPGSEFLFPLPASIGMISDFLEILRIKDCRDLKAGARKTLFHNLIRKDWDDLSKACDDEMKNRYDLNRVEF